MRDSLHSAYGLAEQVRFSRDKLRRQDNLSSVYTNRIRSHFAQHAIRIASEVTPTLSECMDRVFARLHLPPSTTEAYVYSSPEIQAECHSGDNSNCIVRFSSALIDLLDIEEIEFVAGHEVGHFLLGHSGSIEGSDGDSIEHYMLQRCQEISADRVGLLACRSLDAAIRAMMKTISGLNSRHLRFDVTAFLSQLRGVDNLDLGNSWMETHPSILFRCRALLWFSLNEHFIQGKDCWPEGKIATLDQRIEADMDRFVDGPARQAIEDAKENLGIWMAAFTAIEDGILKREEQVSISELFGEQTLQKLKNFLSGLSSSGAQSAVHDRLVAARRELETAIPKSFEAEYEKIKLRIETQFD